MYNIQYNIFLLNNKHNIESLFLQTFQVSPKWIIWGYPFKFTVCINTFSFSALVTIVIWGINIIGTRWWHGSVPTKYPTPSTHLKKKGPYLDKIRINIVHLNLNWDSVHIEKRSVCLRNFMWRSIVNISVYLKRVKH